MMELVRWIELLAVATVAITTIYVMQHHLLKAHVLLRFGLALVCAGSVLEFFMSLRVTDPDPAELYVAVVENVGQAAVYLWAATSKRLWRIVAVLNRSTGRTPCLKAGSDSFME